MLTTKANALMEVIHNSKKRMPVIIPRQYESDWLNPHLTQDDVQSFCQHFETGKMDAYTISRMITDRRIDDKNIPDIYRRFEYPELGLLDA